MEMNDYMAAIRKSIILVIALLAVGLVRGLLTASTAKKSYTSTSQLMFKMQGAKNVSDVNAASVYTMAQMPTYEALATTPMVLDPVGKLPAINLSADEMVQAVKAAQLPQSTMLTITATGDSPALARAIAQGVADQMVKATSDAGGSEVKMAPQVTTPAGLPVAPSAPNKMVYMLAGALLGLIAGVLAAVIRAGLSHRSGEAKAARTAMQ